MTITITAFANSPDQGLGLARDTRVRWALEEVGQPYDVRLVSFAATKEPAHRALNPFGQIPTYEEGDLVLFETGAIILHIAERHAGLLPTDPNARSRAIMWMFAALNTVETPILERQSAMFAEGDKPWKEERMPLIDDRIRARLRDLAARLDEAEWLDGDFSAGDLLMVHTLQRLKPSGLLNEFASLAAYVPRAEARPALWAGVRGAAGGVRGPDEDQLKNLQDECRRAGPAFVVPARSTRRQIMRVMVFAKMDKDAKFEAPTPEQLEAFAAMDKFTEELVAAGVFVAAAGLKNDANAKRLLLDGRGNCTMTDGPFTESKEVVAGFSIWKVKDMEEALAWAARSPMPGVMEILPFYEAEDLADYITPEDLAAARDGDRGKMGVA